MKLTLGFSPCPNDTFIFDALVNGKIDTEGLEFEAVLEDVQTLNEWTLEGKLDITKLSFPAFFQATDKYLLLQAGSALGKGVGPLLVSKEPDVSLDAVPNKTIALPGVDTTAHLLFSFAFPTATNKKFGLFSGIESSVLNGETDLGVIIHENRFTYQERGLHKVIDLGEYWENKMNVPIPLGGIAVNQDLPLSVARKVDRMIRSSLEYAFANYPTLPEYVREHSQAMDEKVMRQHIDLYVNNYSLALGEEGERAIRTLYGVFQKQHPDDADESDMQLFL